MTEHDTAAAPAGVEDLVKHYGFLSREAENVADPASVNREAESAYQAILDAWPQPSADFVKLVDAYGKAVRVPDELRQALSAIADGYPIRVHGDRFISVINPYYQPDDGSDRNLVIDINSLLISETVAPAPAQGETITAIADRVVAALTSDEAVEAVLAELRRRDWVDAAGAPNDTMRDDARAALQAAAKAIRGEQQ